MTVERKHITVQMQSGRIVRAMVVSLEPGILPLVTWGGLPPFHAAMMSHEDILDIEAGHEHPLVRMV